MFAIHFAATVHSQKMRDQNSGKMQKFAQVFESAMELRFLPSKLRWQGYLLQKNLGHVCQYVYFEIIKDC